MLSTAETIALPATVREQVTFEVQYRISPKGKWLRHLDLRPRSAEEARQLAEEYGAETGRFVRAARRSQRITTETVLDILA